MSNEKTEIQFDKVTQGCAELFASKARDYGTAWRILRPESLTDQLLIKARRIRSIETKGTQKIEDDIRGEYVGLVNYSIMALIQLELGFADFADLNAAEAEELYKKYLSEAKKLMLAKNHDYGEAWRDMRISSYTDLILMKIFRVKQIEDNKGKTSVSEGIDANYYDIINYSVFALIRIDFK